MTHSYCTHRARWFFCLALVGLALVGRAGIHLAGATLRFGATPRLTASDWATLYYTIENPDDVQVEVRLSLQADERVRGVFEKDVVIGPRSRILGRELITATAAEQYWLSLFVNGERILRTDIPVRYVDPIEHCELTVLNDDMDYGGLSGLMAQVKLREAVLSTMVGAHRAPIHWAGYGHSRAVVIGRPDFHAMTALQYAALVEYVHRGGTVVFADPRGTMEAARTPLRELLPVTPLQVRLVENVPNLDAWGAQWWKENAEMAELTRIPLESPDGFAFLESCPCGDGMTTLAQGEFPVVRWARCGLGVTGMIALDVTQRPYRDSGIMAPLWDHVLTWAQAPFAIRNYANTRILPAVVSQLTGFRIPSVHTVGAILVSYVLVLVLVLVGGYALRRHVSAWLLAAVFGLLLTAGLFFAAFRQNADRSPLSASILDLRMSSGKRTSGQAVVSLFAKSDIRPIVRENDPDGLIRPLPSPARGRLKEPLEPPLIVRHSGDEVLLPGVHVQALKPRSFVSLHNDLPVGTTGDIRLVYGSEDPELRGTLPPGVMTEGAKALLLDVGGVQPVHMTSAGVSLDRSSAALLQLDTFVEHLSSYLTAGGFPKPSLVLLRPWAESGRTLSVSPDDFEERGYSIEFIPVIRQAAPGVVHVPSSSLQIRPGGGFSSMLFDEGAWRGDVLRRRELVISLEVAMPPAFADMRLRQATVTVDISNAGGNVTLDTRLAYLPLWRAPLVDREDPEQAWRNGVTATSATRGTFVFDGLAQRGIVQPLYGGFRLLLCVSQKTVVTAIDQAERSNRWRINRLDVDVVGALEVADGELRRF